MKDEKWWYIYVDLSLEVCRSFYHLFVVLIHLFNAWIEYHYLRNLRTEVVAFRQISQRIFLSYGNPFIEILLNILRTAGCTTESCQVARPILYTFYVRNFTMKPVGICYEKELIFLLCRLRPVKSMEQQRKLQTVACWKKSFKRSVRLVWLFHWWSNVAFSYLSFHWVLDKWEYSKKVTFVCTHASSRHLCLHLSVLFACLVLWR